MYTTTERVNEKSDGITKLARQLHSKVQDKDEKRGMPASTVLRGVTLARYANEGHTSCSVLWGAYVDCSRHSTTARSDWNAGVTRLPRETNCR
ncbi:hypothetical protein PISMIDRAFT_332076 [Pisolithus microcarpus 441]|uniref:Uncharacterized protein n=1 Tax=Pisolithus microcarpus 441 TaxID=765257 RepID=A0A0C9ZTQ6_9AGAM|nr:hypothetical protein PISMIDRAFT_332076 [Pisolithus microcarpus 441]